MRRLCSIRPNWKYCQPFCCTDTNKSKYTKYALDRFNSQSFYGLVAMIWNYNIKIRHVDNHQLLIKHVCLCLMWLLIISTRWQSIMHLTAKYKHVLVRISLFFVVWRFEQGSYDMLIFIQDCYKSINMIYLSNYTTEFWRSMNVIYLYSSTTESYRSSTDIIIMIIIILSLLAL